MSAMLGIQLCVALLAVLLLFALAQTASAGEPFEERLWSGDAPGSEGVANTERVEDQREKGDPRGPSRRIYDVSVPTLIHYPAPKDKATGTAVIVCPGGAYQRLAIDHEGHEVARWLNSLGVTAAILKYRVGNQIVARPDIERLTLADGKRAVRTVRSKAKQLGVRPDRIGMMGFSAGGNLIARLLSDMDDGKPDADDPIERVGCRPDFVALIYAPIRGLDAKTITTNTPPIFMVHSADDSIPNDRCARLFLDLYQAKVPAELHIYATGGHGFGLGNRGGAVTSWPNLFEQWLKTSAMLRDAFSPDYLAPIGGQEKAVLKADTTVAYRDFDGKEKVAKVVPFRANQAGAVASEWRQENMGRKVAYAFCYLRSSASRKVQCHLGSDEEARVWVNGKLVCQNDALRPFAARADSFTVELAKGLNPVLVKISQRTASWMFQMEALPTDGAAPAPAGTTQPAAVAINDLRPDGRVESWSVMVFDLTPQ